MIFSRILHIETVNLQLLSLTHTEHECQMYSRIRVCLTGLHGLIRISLKREQGVVHPFCGYWTQTLWRVLRRPVVKHHCLPACCHGNTLTLAAGLKGCSQSWRMPFARICEERKKKASLCPDSAEWIEIQFVGFLHKSLHLQITILQREKSKIGFYFV